MKVKKFISISVSVFLIFFIFTSCAFIPELELAGKINVIDVIKVFSFPARTLVYLNKIFTNERKDVPLSSQEDSEKNNKLFKILIFCIMGAILLPASIGLIKPDLTPYSLICISGGRNNKAAPPEFDILSTSRPIFGRQNNRRERRSASFSSLISESNQIDDSDSESSIDHKKFNPQNHIIKTINLISEHKLRCLIIYWSIKVRSLVLSRRFI